VRQYVTGAEREVTMEISAQRKSVMMSFLLNQDKPNKAEAEAQMDNIGADKYDLLLLDGAAGSHKSVLEQKWNLKSDYRLAMFLVHNE
jgi:hypothetical protein